MDVNYSEEKLKEMLSITRQSSNRFFIPSKSVVNLDTVSSLVDQVDKKDDKKKEKSHPAKFLKKKIEAANLINVFERPPNRKQISDLENYLLNQIKEILSDTIENPQSYSSNNLKATKDVKYILTKNSLLKEFKWDDSDFTNKSWIERLYICECLNILCEETSSRFCDMITVTSAELGNLMRKLKRAYRQTYQQMRVSWEELHHSYCEKISEMRDQELTIRDLKLELEGKEEELRTSLEAELKEKSAALESNREDEAYRLRQAELELDQTNTTLQTLNAIFKTMQTDSAITSAGDFRAKYDRLVKEVAELKAENLLFDKTRKSLIDAEEHKAKLERQLKQQDMEISSIRNQLNKRDETIATLMERDALRAAEIEKLTKMANLLSEKNQDKDVDFQEPPTSILCVKCKKSLDDLSNIRAAVLGPGRNDKIQCKTFRILLPNIKGRRPNRTNDWIRLCMRSILIMKMKEDVSLFGIKGNITRFPEYVYSWFEPMPEPGANLPSHDKQQLADENRWGFYYGVKVLSRDDPESSVFFSLLDESLGEDGTAFILYCISIALSIGGDDLWSQFKSTLFKASSINEIPNQSDTTPPVIWLPLKTAKDAVRAVFVKAMETQVREALESIDALKQMPVVEECLVEDQPNEAAAAVSTVEEKEKDGGGSNQNPPPSNQDQPNQDATHINFFTWLRLMAQRYDQERSQRAAAVRLMFETASIGALTPQSPFSPEIEGVQQHVEFPQFQSVVRTLCPHAELSEIAHIYSTCFDEGNRFVTSEVFLRVADKKSLFSKSLRLPPLPILERPKEDDKIHESQIDDADDNNNNDVNNQPPNNNSNKNNLHVPKLQSEEEFWASREEGKSYDTQKYLSELSLIGRETKLRIDLGSIIHRKLSSIMPELQSLMRTVPERWKTLLQELIENVLISLKDSWLKSKKRDHGYGTNIDSELQKPRVGSNIDGLQPFVHYQRLLNMALSIRSLCANPILPGELFKNTRYNILPSSKNIDILKAAKLLSSLETAFLINSNSNCKYVRIDKTIRSILAQKLKTWYKACSRAAGVVIPLKIRLLLRPGYLRGVNTTRHRKVLEEPWWAQTIISKVYFYKLKHDERANILGMPPVSLPNAVISAHISLWGNIDISERCLHDLFLCCHTYSSSIPRLKLFLSFLGANNELDEESKWLLCSERAFNLYIDLVLLIHQVASGESEENEYPWILFPSTETAGATQRDYWLESSTTLLEATRIWSGNLKGMNPELFSQYLDILVSDGNGGGGGGAGGIVDVDDYTWLVMMQWVKSTSMYIKTAKEKIHFLQRQSNNEQQNANKTTTKAVSLHKMGDIMESIYSKKNKDIIAPGNITVDMVYGSKLYAQSHSLSKISENKIADVIKNWLIWDLSSSSSDGDDVKVNKNKTTRSMISNPTNSQISVAIAIKAWNILKDIIADQVSQYNSMPLNSDSKDAISEQDRRLQLIRKLKLKLDEYFLHVTTPSEEKIDSDNNLLSFPEFSFTQSNDIWKSLQSLLSLFGEYLENLQPTMITFPKDNWKRGMRIHMEKSKALSIQSALSSISN